MTKKKKYDQMQNMKDTMGLGIGSMAGMGAIGAMSAIPGMPATNIPGIASAGIGLANVGQLAKTGMGITGMFGQQQQTTRTYKKRKHKKK